jgi:hypothetical protein
MRVTAMADSYQEQIARMRMERAQRETVQRLQEIRNDYHEATRSRDEAAARGDTETFEMMDDDCMRLEQEAAVLQGPQRPQIDQRLVQFAQRNQPFFEKYGVNAYRALDEAHKYMMRPRNPNTNHPGYTGMGWNPQAVFTPQYFEKLKDLLELHGENFLGVKFDRNEERLTPNEAAEISGLSPRQYNQALRQVAARLGQDRKS